MWSRSCGRSLVVDTPAKLNLFLEILGKRADGYHELETLMVTVGIYDTLVFTDVPEPIGPLSEESNAGIRLRVFDAGRAVAEGRGNEGPIPTGADNLVVRAARLLQEHTGLSRFAQIDLIKRIPAAAGLAGGSSDAAATLWGLNRLWNAGLSDPELRDLASRLGSDIPFFLAGRPAAVCRGRGEIIEPVDLPQSLHFVIARPSEGLSTALVYRHCRPAERPRDAAPLLEDLKAGRLCGAATKLHNALQEPAERLSTEVAKLKSRFSQQPVIGHQMSGSGTAWFGLCAHRRQAQQIAARLQAARAGRVFVVQSRP